LEKKKKGMKKIFQNYKKKIQLLIITIPIINYLIKSTKVKAEEEIKEEFQEIEVNKNNYTKHLKQVNKTR
jgi:hypothetical protein